MTADIRITKPDDVEKENYRESQRTAVMTDIVSIVEDALIGKLVKLGPRPAREVVSMDWEYGTSGDLEIYLNFAGSNYRARIGIETDFEIVE